MLGKGPATVALRFLDIVLPGALDPPYQGLVYCPDNACRDAENQRTGRHHHTFRQHRACTDHRASTDPNAVQQDCPHPNEGFILHGATMEKWLDAQHRRDDR